MLTAQLGVVVLFSRFSSTKLPEKVLELLTIQQENSQSAASWEKVVNNNESPLDDE